MPRIVINEDNSLTFEQTKMGEPSRIVVHGPPVAIGLGYSIPDIQLTYTHPAEHLRHLSLVETDVELYPEIFYTLLRGVQNAGPGAKWDLCGYAFLSGQGATFRYRKGKWVLYYVTRQQWAPKVHEWPIVLEDGIGPSSTERVGALMWRRLLKDEDDF